MSDIIGWAATALFAASYFVRRPAAMRWVQAAAAVCWIVYGVLLHATPVIAANLIVASLAGFSAWRMASPRRGEAYAAGDLESSGSGS